MTAESNDAKPHHSRTRIVGLALVLALAAAYFASPLGALYALKSAVQSGSKDRLDALVDFPAVRDDLKSQINARIAQAVNEPDMKDNPFAGLAALVAPAIVGRMVDMAVTPDGISTLIRDGKIEQASDQSRPVSRPTGGDPTVRRIGYLTLDRFKVSLDSAGTPPASMSLVLERRGVITWKLIKIELPADAFPKDLSSEEPAHQPEADVSEESPPASPPEPAITSSDAAADQGRYEEERRLQRIRDHEARVSCYTHGGPPC